MRSQKESDVMRNQSRFLTILGIVCCAVVLTCAQIVHAGNPEGVTATLDLRPIVTIQIKQPTVLVLPLKVEPGTKLVTKTGFIVAQKLTVDFDECNIPLPHRVLEVPFELNETMELTTALRLEAGTTLMPKTIIKTRDDTAQLLPLSALPSGTVIRSEILTPEQTKREVGILYDDQTLLEKKVSLLANKVTTAQATAENVKNETLNDVAELLKKKGFIDLPQRVEVQESRLASLENVARDHEKRIRNLEVATRSLDQMAHDLELSLIHI